MCYQLKNPTFSVTVVENTHPSLGIYLTFLAGPGLRYSVDFSLVAVRAFSLWGLLLLWRGLWGARGPVAAAPWASEHGLSSCGAWAWLLSMWGLPGPGIEPVCPALARSSPLSHQGSPVKHLLSDVCKQIS